MNWARWTAGLVVAGNVILAQAAPPPVADFFKDPQLNDLALSPSGRYIAATRRNDKTHYQMLVVIDLGEKREARVLASYNDADVMRVHWVNDDRIVFELGDQSSTYFNQYGRGLFSVSRAGDENPKIVVRRDWGPAEVNLSSQGVRVRPRDNSLDPDHWFHSTLLDGSLNVMVEKGSFDTTDHTLISTQLLRVNSDTGRAEVVGREVSGHANEWVTDARGNPRVAFAYNKDIKQILWRADPASDQWALLREMPRYDKVTGRDPILGVLGMDDQDRLYIVTGGDNPAGTTVLATLDLRKPGATPTPLVSAPGYDFQGSLVQAPNGRVVGVNYLTDAWGTAWFDPKLKAIQEQIDKALPNTNNMIDCGACDNPSRVLVAAYSDRQPTAYVLYHVAAGKFEQVSSARPWIKPEEMANRGFERIKARDGLEFPVHVTRPNGVKGPAPTVILVHGGPWVRGGDWKWDAESQFLASRGYAVIEPEFRGSKGYGSTLYFASWKQWGLAMQDDVADATKWAIDKGVTDPKRVCIAGASYGGYATLMGLVRYPELYRCGIESFGVTDIDLMYTSHWSDASSDYKTYGMPLRIGDREKDAAQLAATSPLKQHAKINQPLLMAAGRQDKRVPIEHYNKMLDALKTHNPNVESVVYNEEAHGWNLDANEIDFWTRAEKFLDKHLKNAP
jgi:dipeptidyl aminopeptidase/acylaminoacyl peptidase